MPASTPPGEERPAPLDETPSSPADEPPRRLPIGCHPLVFGVVAATLQMAGILLLLRTCG